MYYSVIKVKTLPNFQLLLEFENGEERVFNMNEYLDKGIFTELKDKDNFKSVRVSFDSIEWENGADLDPEILYHDSKPVQIIA